MEQKEFHDRLERRLKAYSGLPLTRAVADSLSAEVWEELNCILTEGGLPPVPYSEFREGISL